MGVSIRNLGGLTACIIMLCVSAFNAGAAPDPQLIVSSLDARFNFSGQSSTEIPTFERQLTSATLPLNELKHNIDAFDNSVLGTYGTYLERPDVELDRTMKSNHFRIHFTFEGEHAIGSYDGGYPVGQVLAACEESWWSYVIEQDWPEPLSDNLAGSDSLIDVYVIDLGENVFGYAMHEDLPDQPGKTGFIVIDSHIQGRNGLTGLEILKSTIAHEYHHLIQFSYGYRSEATWFMEQLAMMEEHHAFGDIFNTLQELNRYLPIYTEHAYRRLDTCNGAFEYGAWLWPQFISERYGMEIIIDAWSIWRDEQLSMLAALDRSLGNSGVSLSDAVAQWAVWNIFLGSRDDGAHYSQGQYFSASVRPETSIASYPQNHLHPSVTRQPEAYGASYLEFRYQAGSGHNLLTVVVNGCDNLTGAHVVTWSSDGLLDDIREIKLLDGRLDFTIEKWDKFEKAWLVLTTGGDADFSCDYAVDAKTEFRPISSVDDEWLIGDEIKLRNAPNPFEAFTKIYFNLPEPTWVMLKIFSPEGRLVRKLIDNEVSAGGHAIFWDGADRHGVQVPSGVFYAILRTEYMNKHIRMVRMQ